MSFRYQETNEFFAQVAHPIEELGAAELTELGATSVRPAYRGVFFTAEFPVLCRIVYTTRLCTRILAPLIRFDCHSDKYLHRTASSIDWSSFLSVDETFAVAATVNQSRITHSQYAALRLKDAICDQFRERENRRPSIDRQHPDIWFNLHIQNNQATISVDVAGGSLHRRGYRTASVEAPLQETVAAAVVRMSDWNADAPLIDPMCGSGTILAEALMYACNIPSAYLREHFGFERLPEFDVWEWTKIRKECDAAIRPLPEGCTISGSDIDGESIRAAKTNLAALPQGDTVSLDRQDFFERAPISGSVIITNPPYGLRLGRGSNIENFYRQIGDFLKQQCTGSTAFLYAGKRELLKSVGLRTKWKKALVNGALDGRLARYDLY